LGRRVACLCLAASGPAQAEVCSEPFTRPVYPTRQAFCLPGDLVPDAYDGNRVIRCEEMEVDHLISLRQAWASGVCGDDLKRLATDPRNLRFTYWQTNRKKGFLSPEAFAERLDPKDAERVLSDAQSLMRDYGIQSAEDAAYNRMLGIVLRDAAQVKAPAIKVSGSLLRRITFEKIGGRTVAYVGKKAVGYAIGVGAAIDVVGLSAWATDWLMTPTQTDRMAARAEMFKDIFEVAQ
jgi:hypothetical protein